MGRDDRYMTHRLGGGPRAVGGGVGDRGGSRDKMGGVVCDWGRFRNRASGGVGTWTDVRG